MRERLNKNLKVTTSMEKTADRPGKTPFRHLKEGESIRDFFDFGDEIYSGGEKGKVIVAKRKSDAQEVVLKVRTKHSNKVGERSWKAIMNQVLAMKRCGHVLDILEIVEDVENFYVVMPKCNGGELFEFLVNETEVPEGECKRIIREILVAVGHLHKNHLVHRDIKPENIMFQIEQEFSRGVTPGEPNTCKSAKTVKLIDFDTCLEWTPATPKSRRFVGTPGYIAPEALLGEITPQSDLWSIGVILYILMTGETPWSSLVSLEDGTVGSPGAKKMYAALKDEILDWDKEPWPDFPAARDLCKRLMAFELADRVTTVQDCLNHPWLQTA